MDQFGFDGSVSTEQSPADSFLSHMETLENAKTKAEAEMHFLLGTQEKLQEELRQANEERDLAGQQSMNAYSEEAALEARLFAQKIRRNALQKRLEFALKEEVRLRLETTRALELERSDSTRRLLYETQEKLNAAAIAFEQTWLLTASSEHGMSRFEIERATSLLKLVKQDLEQTQSALRTTQENESKLMQKHETERYRNEVDGIF